MFFSITKQRNKRFHHQWNCDRFHIGTDAGWRHVDLDRFWVLYKGYCDDGIIHRYLNDIIDSDLPTRTGNFCMLVWDRQDRRWQVKHDVYRSFPVYYVPETHITNYLKPSGATKIHTNNHIIWDDDLRGDITAFDINPELLSNPVTAIDIRDFLSVKIQKFCADNPLPIKIYLSGGVDTLLIFSFLKHLNIDFELVMAEHFDLDDFLLLNLPDLPNWSYKQIHHWIEPCVLASGAPGDEFTLRSPTYLNWYCLQYGQDIRDMLKINDQCLHYQYFTTQKSLSQFQQQADTYTDIDDLRSHVMNIIANDYQHYHMGNTITWTPLRDLRLFDMFCNLSQEDQIGQILDSKISKDIIEMNVPGLPEVLSDQKNHSYRLANLRQIRKYHQLGKK